MGNGVDLKMPLAKMDDRGRLQLDRLEKEIEEESNQLARKMYKVSSR